MNTTDATALGLAPATLTAPENDVTVPESGTASLSDTSPAASSESTVNDSPGDDKLDGKDTIINVDLAEIPGPAEAAAPWYKRWWNYYKSSSLLQALTAVILAFGIGALVYELVTKGNPSALPKAVIQLVALPGNFWLQCLRCLVIPLIASSMIISANNLKRMSKDSGKITLFTISYYILTTLIAACFSLLWIYVVLIPNVKPIDPSTMPPGLTADMDNQNPDDLAPLTWSDQIVLMVTMLVPKNLFEAMAKGELLGIVVVFMVLGFLIEEEEGTLGSVVLKGAHEVSKVVTKVMHFLIMLMPFGIFFLILPNVMAMEIGVIFSYVGIYVATLAVGVGSMLLIVYPSLYFLLTRKNPLRVLVQAFPAMATAFGTSSSAATLPVTMSCCETLGVRETIAGFVAPLGATINMDAASMYICAGAVFMGAAQGIPLTFGNAIVIVLVATLASIGAAPIPSAGLVFILTTMTTVGIPTPPIFGLIVMVDWLADRIATAGNVAGDVFATCIVDARYGASLDEGAVAQIAANKEKLDSINKQA